MKLGHLASIEEVKNTFWLKILRERDNLEEVIVDGV